MNGKGRADFRHLGDAFETQTSVIEKRSEDFDLTERTLDLLPVRTVGKKGGESLLVAGTRGTLHQKRADGGPFQSLQAG